MNLIRIFKKNFQKAVTHLFDKIFIRTYTIKFSKYGMLWQVWHLNIADNSELLSGSSQKATTCNNYVLEEQRESYLLLSFET